MSWEGSSSFVLRRRFPDGLAAACAEACSRGGGSDGGSSVPTVVAMALPECGGGIGSFSVDGVHRCPRPGFWTDQLGARAPMSQGGGAAATVLNHASIPRAKADSHWRRARGHRSKEVKLQIISDHALIASRPRLDGDDAPSKPNARQGMGAPGLEQGDHMAPLL